MAEIDFQPIDFKEDGGTIDFQPLDFQPDKPSFFGQIARNVQGALEIPLAVATGAIAYPVSQAAYLGKRLFGHGKEAAQQAESEWADRLQYRPQTPEGQAGTEILMSPITAIMGMGKESGELVGESWGIPKDVAGKFGEYGSLGLMPTGLRGAREAAKNNIVTAVAFALMICLDDMP